MYRCVPHPSSSGREQLAAPRRRKSSSGRLTGSVGLGYTGAMTSTPQPKQEPVRVHVGADGHVHFDDPDREAFWNATWKFGEQLLAENGGDVDAAIAEAAERMI